MESRFSAARNFAISKASNDYIFMIDSDEILASCDKKELETYIQRYPDGIGRVMIISEYYRDNEKYSVKNQVSRIFSKKKYCYQGRIHEQVVPIEGETGTIYDAPIHIFIMEDMMEIWRQGEKKTERNINLLKKELEDKGMTRISYIN